MSASGGPIICPYCESDDAELLSLFGQQLMTVQYYCNNCRTPFERVKDETVYEQARHRARETDQNAGGIKPSE